MRTLAEIAEWKFLTETKRTEITQSLPLRKEVFEQEAQLY